MLLSTKVVTTIGICGLLWREGLDAPDIGFAFLPEFWGRGLATEAGAASIEFARSTLGLARLVAMVHPDNVASARVVTKLGFSVEKKLRYSGLPGIDIDLFARSLATPRCAAGVP